MAKMDNHTLDFSAEAFETLLKKASEQVLNKFQSMESDMAFSGLTPEVIQEWMSEPLPNGGMDTSDLLDMVQEKVVDTATMNMAPKMFAYVMAGGTQVSILAELLATTINQNIGKWHLAPVLTEMEKQVSKWGAQFIGYDADAAGVLVSGGSAANLTGLTVARNVYFQDRQIQQKGIFGMKPFTVYASVETHNCVDKSIDILGIGTDHYRKIPVNNDFTINLAQLNTQIEKDIQEGFEPFCLIGNAGTVNTGAIDDLDELASIAQQHEMWYHIDGAYGALAAGTDLVKDHYKGIEQADSVALDFHKWLYQPFEAGCTLVRDYKQFNQAYFKKASYLATDQEDNGRLDFNEHQFQLSRNGKALKIWMSFKAYGADRLKAMIEKDIHLTRYLAQTVEASTDFELSSDPLLGIVCFKYIGSINSEEIEKIDELNQLIIPALEKDRRVFITGTRLGDRSVIRACLINHRLQKQHIDHLVQVLREVGQEVEQQINQEAVPG
ncbi:MAG: pyridoxal-dependent decarboxylase [Cytophagales bacterium]|nr:pyridoxal-dependent decarboxylase [Cytophagales bacterium]